MIKQNERRSAAMTKPCPSSDAARSEDADVYAAPLSIRERHEFLTYDTEQPTAERYELDAVYAGVQ